MVVASVLRGEVWSAGYREPEGSLPIALGVCPGARLQVWVLPTPHVRALGARVPDVPAMASWVGGLSSGVRRVPTVPDCRAARLSAARGPLPRVLPARGLASVG